MDLAFSAAATEDERLDQAEAEVRGYCGWHIAPSVTEEVTAEGDGSSVLLLPSLRVSAVHSVTDEDGNAVTDWKVRRNGVLRRACGWRCGVEYTVSLTHGYDEVPADLTAAVQAIASAPTEGRVRSQTQTDGPFTRATVYDVPAGQSSALDRYKLPPRP